MKYFMRTNADAPSTAVTPEMMQRIGGFMEEGFRNGTLVATGALDPRTIQVVSRDGKVTFTDGPFSEAKEAVVGWAIVNVDDVEGAKALSAQFWDIVGDGSGSIQRIYDPGEQPVQG